MLVFVFLFFLGFFFFFFFLNSNWSEAKLTSRGVRSGNVDMENMVPGWDRPGQWFVYCPPSVSVKRSRQRILPQFDV